MEQVSVASGKFHLSKHKSKTKTCLNHGVSFNTFSIIIAKFNKHESK